MHSLADVGELRTLVAGWRQAGQRIGFVPTMGNLHEGHLQLVRHALSRVPRVVVSVFVNPTQFGPSEDFDSYPRTLEDDREKLIEEGVDLLFAPSVTTVYPGGAEQATFVEVPVVSRGLCGDFRPGHFTAVTSVVARLFNMVQPDIAVFGEKDFQQLAVIRRMVRDLCWPIDVQGVATVREPDGLAMSSRNRYLSAEQRTLAPLLYRTLCEVAEQVRHRQQSCEQLEAQATQRLEQAGFEPEYVSIRHAETLQGIAIGEAPAMVLAAARLGGARLIDNVRV